MEVLSLYTQYQSKILIILLIMMFLCDKCGLIFSIKKSSQRKGSLDDMREQHKSVTHFNRLIIGAV